LRVNRTGGTRRGTSGEWLKASYSQSRIPRQAPGYRRARLSALAGGAFGSGLASTPPRSRCGYPPRPLSPRRTSRAVSAADQGAGREEICRLRGASDYRRDSGQLVGGEVNCWHGPDIIGRHFSLKARSVSHNDQRTRIAPLIRKRVDRATNFATKVDLVTARYPVEEREEIAELLQFLLQNLRPSDVKL